MFDNQALSVQVGEQEFVVEREFNAPRTLMFQVFTRPEYLKEWWAPKPYTISSCKVDLRPGGLWHYAMRSPEGQDFWARHVYKEISEPSKLVYTSSFADEQGNPTEGLPLNTTTLTFTEINGKTRVSARIEFATGDELKTSLALGMLEGTKMTWTYLGEYVQELQKA